MERSWLAYQSPTDSKQIISSRSIGDRKISLYKVGGQKQFDIAEEKFFLEEKQSRYRKEFSIMSAAIELRLSRAERRRFVRQVKKTKDVKYSRRMHALLGLALGLAVGVVASQSCVRRQTIWLWVKLYLANRNEQDLRPYESPGRPRKTTIDQDFQIVETVESDPQEEGYAATCWTASLLRTHLEKVELLSPPGHLDVVCMNSGIDIKDLNMSLW